jgi:PAS domain S-box-containing protein
MRRAVLVSPDMSFPDFPPSSDDPAGVSSDVAGGLRSGFQVEASLRAVVDHVPTLIAYVDSQQRYRFANETFREWFGIDPSTMIGLTVAEVFGVESAVRAQGRFARVMAGETVDFETEIKVGEEMRFVRATYVPDHSADGVVRGFYLTVSDITERERSDRALQELTALQVAILDSANLAIIATDVHGVIWTFNSTAERWLGYRVEEIIGHTTPAIFLDPAEMGARRREFENLMGRPLVTIVDWVLAATQSNAHTHDEREWAFIRKDGSRFLVALSFTVLRDAAGQPTGVLGVARDIAKEKAAEAAQRLAREAAEQASRAKSQFLANMSHEVRTPLHGIIGVTGMLIETPLDAAQRQLAETVHASAQALLAVVGRVLDFSRIEAGQLVLEEVDFSPESLVREVTRLHAIHAGEKGVALESYISPEVPEYVRGDVDRLRQIVHNLVGNAVKFSSRGTVRVRVEMAFVDGSRRAFTDDRVRLLFSVQDEGIGIPLEAQGRIFEPFAQADESMTRRFGGTGLGLAIARQLVELMGGELVVESAPGVGAAFRFTAGFASCSGEGMVFPVIPGAKAWRPLSILPGRLRVLLVEDSEVNRMVAQHLLKQWGCVLTAVDGGHAAVEAAERENFDLILMDCQMPGMDGYAATAEIRRREAKTGQRARIVALTANVLKGERERCLAAGMDEYLAKPFRMTQLATIVSAVACVLSPAPKPVSIGVAELARLRASPSTTGQPLLARLVQIFQQEAPMTLATLVAAAERGEIPALEIAAHKLKGASGNFGAARLEQLCQVVEDLCHEDQARFVAWLIPEIEAEVHSVLEALQRVL